MQEKRNDFKNLSQGLGIKHLYNSKTGVHIYKGIKYTKKEWFDKFIKE
jgi:hypothetical protein